MGTRTIYFIFFAGLILVACRVLSDSILTLHTGLPDCHITQLELSDTYLVAWGDELILHAEANCDGDIPLITITANDEAIIQANTTNLWLPINTAHYPFGEFTLCVSAIPENDSDESVPVSVCHTVWLVDGYALHER